MMFSSHAAFVNCEIVVLDKNRITYKVHFTDMYEYRKNIITIITHNLKMQVTLTLLHYY
jgi:Zn-dependent peptidase ImmA (M78 family)